MRSGGVCWGISGAWFGSGVALPLLKVSGVPGCQLLCVWAVHPHSVLRTFPIMILCPPVPSCHLRAGSAGERLPRPQRTQGTRPAVTQGIFVSICVHLNNFQSGGWSSPCPKAALNSGGHLGGFTGTVACPGTGAVLPAAVRSLGALPNRARDVDQEPLSSPPRGRELCWWLRSPIPVFSPIFPPLRSACAVKIPPSAL